MIRKMALEDLDTIMILESQLFSCPWTIENYRFELTENPYSHYVVLDEKGIKAYLGLWVNDGALQITTLGVDTAVQNRGYGKALVQYAIDYAESINASVITLEVRISNQIAIQLYESFGFKKAALRKQYYSHPDEDAILMMKQLYQM
jgi:ribosomal-protein-alanine N-acetyltransferase